MRLQTVIDSVGDGLLQFPDFQRDFVWSDAQRLRLMDSVLKGLPIGSILVWRTKEIDLAVKRDLLPNVPQPLKDDRGNFVLDGLQRLVTLYRALGQYEAKDGTAARWPILFDLDTSLDEGDEDRFHLAPVNREPPTTWIPLSVLLSAERLYEAQKKLIDLGRPELANKAERLANAFKDYELPLIPLLTENIEQAAQSFERVNSQGSRMGEGEMLRALTYRQDSFDLTEEFDKITESLEWDQLDHQVYVNTLKVLLDMSIYRAELRQIVAMLRDSEDVLVLLRDAFKESVSFLCGECGVWGEWALPYAYQLVALAKVHVELSLKTKQVASFGPYAPRLRTWFWATTYSEYFSGKTGTQLNAAFQYLERVVTEDESPIPAELVNQPVVELTRVWGGSVRTLARAHLLAQQSLVDEQGREINGASLLKWGSTCLHKLFLDAPAGDPANRFLAAPEDAKRVRRHLTEPMLMGTVPAQFFTGHLLDPPKAGQTSDQTLNARRERLRRLESGVVHGLGLKYQAAKASFALSIKL